MDDKAFIADKEGLARGLEKLFAQSKPAIGDQSLEPLPAALPESGCGALNALDALSPLALDQARDLSAPDAFAHMDPPTPWVSWVAALWAASKNQNLLHPDTAPVARDIEARVVQWLAPFFGMDGGHMTPGSTMANLTALWAARDQAKVRSVVASKAAHLSIRKAAHILGLEFIGVETDQLGRLDPSNLPADLTDKALVLTAGATSTGAIDPLDAGGGAAWVHVDAAWAGPMRLSDKLKARLDGIDLAHSVAVSAHKWLFQPKESAFIFFRDTAKAHETVSFEGAYLSVPNIGLQGSHGAQAIILAATLLSYGRVGLAKMIDQSMTKMDALAAFIRDRDDLILFGPNMTGVLLWRPYDQARMDGGYRALPDGATSKTVVNGEPWFRQVAANPLVDIDELCDAIKKAFD